MQQHTQILGRQTSLFTTDSATSSQWVYPVNPIAQLENGSARKMNAICGPKVLEQYGRYPRAGSFSKTFAALLIGMEVWSSTRCRLTWSLRATRSHRFYFLLQVSTRRTGEIGYGLLPTPDASLATGGKVSNPENVSITGRTMNGEKRQISLADYVKRGLLPTPIVMDSGGTTSIIKIDARRKKMKTKHNGKNGMKYSGNGFGLSLGELAQRMPGETSQLNPLFVQEMMGYPSDWCLLPFLNGEKNL